jgi:hypothetical protein
MQKRHNMQQKKTYHSKEYELQLAVCKYIRYQYPNILFRSDLGGIKLTKGLAIKSKRIQHSKGFPDLFLYYPSGKYNGLAIELKVKDIFKKDGTLRKSEHLEQQQKVLDILNANNYYATFAVGFNEAKTVIDNYVGL